MTADPNLSPEAVERLVEAANQARLALAGYVSAQSAIDKLDAALAALAAAPQPVPVDRKTLVEVIEQGFQDARHMEDPRPHEAIADALLARGLRLRRPRPCPRCPGAPEGWLGYCSALEDR